MTTDRASAALAYVGYSSLFSGRWSLQVEFAIVMLGVYVVMRVSQVAWSFDRTRLGWARSVLE